MLKTNKPFLLLDNHFWRPPCLYVILEHKRKDLQLKWLLGLGLAEAWGIRTMVKKALRQKPHGLVTSNLKCMQHSVERSFWSIISLFWFTVQESSTFGLKYLSVSYKVSGKNVSSENGASVFCSSLQNNILFIFSLVMHIHCPECWLS